MDVHVQNALCKSLREVCICDYNAYFAMPKHHTGLRDRMRQTELKTLVEVTNLTRYYGTTPAVQDVNFTLNRGEILGFLGPNGAGKSTTMQLLAGCLAPDAGQIRLNGIDLLQEPRQAKAHLGYLAEQPPLYRELTVDEYLVYCARLHRIPRSAITAAVRRAKACCGLSSVNRRLIGNLSKGYQQRVGIAQAIVHGPSIIILDEPTVGLDPIQWSEIRELIRELGQEHGIILSTHILPEVQAICSHVQIMHRGCLVYASSLTDFTQRGKDHLLIKFSLPPTPEYLATLPGIAHVDSLGAGCFRLRCAPHSNPVADLVTCAYEQGWGLRELIRESLGLEQVFIDLTLGCTEAA